MDERKKCLSCKAPLLSFQGSYLHPDSPCNGLRDSISIEATIDNEDIQAKWEEIYGKPDMDDYVRVGFLEQENAELRKVINTSIFQKIKSFF